MSSKKIIFVKRGEDRAPEAICPICGEVYVLGVNGTVGGCDDCTKTQRAVNGFVIKPACYCYEIVGDNPKCLEHGKGGK